MRRLPRYFGIAAAAVLLLFSTTRPEPAKNAHGNEWLEPKFNLEGCGYLSGKEVVFVAKDFVGSVLGRNVALYAVSRTTGDVEKELPSSDGFIGVDGAGRVYHETQERTVRVTSQGEDVKAEVGEGLQGWEAAYDEGVVGGNRYSISQLRIVSDKADVNGFTDVVWQWALPIDNEPDPPGAFISVSPDGELMYVWSEWEAWVWDNHGNLRYVLGLVNPQRNSPDYDKIDAEMLGRIPGIFIPSAPDGYFDNFHRLWVYYNGRMWAMNERGQHVTGEFPLPGKGKEVAEPDGRWVFSRSDNHMFVLNKKDGLVYEYDISPTLERKRDENNGLLYAAGKPPVLVRSFALNLPK